MLRAGGDRAPKQRLPCQAPRGELGPLYFATTNGHVEVVRSLLGAGLMDPVASSLAVFGTP